MLCSEWKLWASKRRWRETMGPSKLAARIGSTRARQMLAACILATCCVLVLAFAPPPNSREAPPNTPAKPQGQAGKNSATFSWPAADSPRYPIYDYVIQLSTDDGSTWISGQGVSPNQLSYTYDNLTPGVAVRARVSTSNRLGRSEFSEPSDPVTVGTPLPPSTIQVRSGPTSLDVKWSASKGNGSPVQDYGLQLSLDRGRTWISGVAVGGTRTRYSYTNLTPGTTAVVTIAALNEIGWGARSAPSPPVVVGAPSARQWSR